MNQAAVVPVLISQYANDLYVARSVDGPNVSASGRNAKLAMDQVKAHLLKLGRRDEPNYWPSNQLRELEFTTVRVRLYDHDGNRKFPVSREFKLPVRFISTPHVDGSLECFLPDFDAILYSPARRELDDLITHYVRGETSSMSSRQLAAVTPPTASQLRKVHVRIRSREQPQTAWETATLESIASPLAGRRRRRSHSASLTGLLIQRNPTNEILATRLANQSTIMVGPNGCGKSTVIKAAANRIQSEREAQAKQLDHPRPAPLFWQCSAEHLIAGMQYLGQWEERVEHVIAELESIGGVLVLSSLVDLVRLGGSGPTDSLAAFLQPFIRRGELRLVAEATPDELDRVRRLLPGFAECFEVTSLSPVTTTQCVQIVDGMLTEAARNDYLKLGETSDTINLADVITRLHSRFMPYQALPRGPLELTTNIIEHAKEGDGHVRLDNVLAQFSRASGLPKNIIDDQQALSADEVRSSLSRELIGQDQAVNAAVDVVLKLKAGMPDPKRPIATMMFCGPTGVGKTQLAKTLATYLFGCAARDDSPLIRLDMSELASYDSVDRLTTGPDGEVAKWLGRLRSHPLSIVLLDEFEKASGEVHDALLSALDEGRLTDRFGRTTTLCGSVIILTSNVGSRRSTPVGFEEGNRRSISHAIEQAFRPEFLNRIDEIVLFDALPHSAIVQIVEKELKSLAQHESLRRHQLRLVWNGAVVERLAESGFDPLLGVRPLQRTIVRQIVSPLARYIIEHPESRNREIHLEEVLAL